MSPNLLILLVAGDGFEPPTFGYLSKRGKGLFLCFFLDMYYILWFMVTCLYYIKDKQKKSSSCCHDRLSVG
jgi:hypothetical protein